MKHTYLTPSMEFLLLANEDVISTSLPGGTEGAGEVVDFEDFIGAK